MGHAQGGGASQGSRALIRLAALRASRLLRRGLQAYKRTSPRRNGAGRHAFDTRATIRFVYKPSGLQSEAPVNTPGQPQAPSELRPVKVDRWWRESSFDLWQGLEVREDPPDTMPAQWLDEIESQPLKKKT